MVTPTDEPSLPRLTTSGSGKPITAAGPSLPSAGPPLPPGSSLQRGVGTPWLSKIRFEATLSIASALARIPEPVNGMPRQVSRPWTAPSSP